MSSELDAVAVAAALTSALRREGVPVGIDRTQAFVTGAGFCGDLYWAGRLSLLGCPADVPVYDRVFGEVLGASPLERESDEPGDELRRADREALLDGADGEEGREASLAEVLRYVPFDALSDGDVAALARALATVRRRPPVRRARRRRSMPRGRTDLRRTMRDVHRRGGEATLPRFSAPAVQVQPITFLVDVSGSMRSAVRAVLLACASFARADRAHEVLTFGTRLTRVGPLLRGPVLEDALDAACAAVPDREGGTRIGESLHAFLQLLGKTRAVRGAVVVIYSDGLERGDPALLAAQMRRLGLLARRVVWLNPLSAGASYEPLARGMRAALPFVDTFGSGHDLASFEVIVEATLDEVSPW